MQRLSALDATFLEVEDAVSHMHIASIALFEGPPLEPQELHEMVLAKLPLVPRYRQVVRFVPFSAGRPVWVDDPHFNLEYHLRHSALPTPGSEEQLHMTDRARDVPAARPHQAAVGDVGGGGAGASRRAACVGADLEDPPLHGRRRRRRTDLLTVMLDRCTRTPRSLPPRWTASPTPRRATRAARPRSRCGSPMRPLAGAMRPAARRGRSPSAAQTPLGPAADARGVLARTPARSLNGPIGATPALVLGAGASSPTSRQVKADARRHRQRHRAGLHHRRLP